MPVPPLTPSPVPTLPRLRPRVPWAGRGALGSRARRAVPALLALAAVWLLAMVAGAASAQAAEVTCPNANPIVNENNCMGEGTEANRLSNYSESIGGFTTQTSYNHGENVQLKIGTSASSFPSTSVNVSVYRMGWYGGKGARLIPAAGATNVKVNNSLTCNPMNKETGELSCSNWNVTYTIPGSALPVSGIYEATFTDLADGGIQNEVIFTVREERASEVLFVLPASSYEAYNTWGCKSLYFDVCGLGNTVAGDERAVKVSFDRPLAEGEEERNKFFGPDYRLLQWVEQQGYDVTYTDDVQLATNPESLLDHRVDVISGHSEYWSYAAFHNMLAAREHGVNIASFSANTAYWQTRFENNYRTLVCYKTVQGSNSGGVTPNDPAAIGPKGEFLPQLATTTRRDPGAPAGSPNAPPEGRVGVNEPENELFGSLYVGDNEAQAWGLTVPAGNVNGEYEGGRIWRNAGIPTNSATIIDKDLVGWEWDQIPSPESPVYAHAAELEPEGVKRLSLTNTSSPETTFLQDYGRERAATPPPGQPAAVSATEYRAKSGAYVFASGTMQWSYGLDVDSSIDQATYNVLAEMGVQPLTPEAGLKLESPNAPKPPWPQFTATPKKALVGEPVEFNASATTDPDASITHYYWDFEGKGFTVETGTTPSATHTFAEPGTYEVVLKVIDSAGQEETTARTVVVKSSITAALAASPNPASIGQQVTFSAAGSSDVHGPITDYRWDLNGSGKFETDSGSTPTVTTSFAAAGEHTVSVRESDASANTATATLTQRVVTIGVSNYEEAVLGTPSLLHFYPLGEASGPTIKDVKGAANGTVDEVVYGSPGAVNGDPATSLDFPGAGDPAEGQPGSSGQIPLNLSSQSAVTVEFWMKWAAYGNNDALAMELTPNYNTNVGGFIVDPNAPQYGGTFGVGVGMGTTRNSIFLERPSAGVWHHYVFVLDTTAPAASEITPYVDGQKVSFKQEGAGTGGGPFANSTLYLMSRDASTLFGSGYLQDLAIYGGDLSAATVEEHHDANGTDPRPKAAFTASPSPARPGQTVTFNANESSYGKGSIVKYEWDLKGTGNYETTTTTPTVTASYASEGTVKVGLRVTDSNGGWSYTTREVKVGNFPPVAHVAVAPSAPLTGQKVTLNASGSTDQGTITDYRWDLEGRGEYTTDTGTTPTVSTYFHTAGIHNVGLQLTDNEGLVSKTTIPIKVLEQGPSGYTPAVLNTPGLLHYYKLGESAGPTVHDSVGAANGTVSGGTFGVTGAVKGDPSTALGFNGTSDSGAIPLNLSSTSQVTVEFWLKWNAYANNDSLAMEFTPNFNANSGGFLVDPDAPQFGGTFGVALGPSENRYSVFFARPSAGVWHHYVLVLNGGAPAGSEIAPYVDGEPVTYQIGSNGSGAGAFANSTLYLMSRAGSALFGAGDLQDLAIYNAPLSGGTAYQHFSSEGAAEPPHPAFTVSPNPVRAGEAVTLNASGSTDSDAKIVDYQWALSGNGNYETDTGSTPTVTTSFATPGTYEVTLRTVDSNGASESVTHKIEVGNFPPVAKLTASSNPAIAGKNVTLSAAESTDQGTITDYRWDLEGKGEYTTDTGTTPTVTTSFAGVGAHTVGVEAIDDHGLSTRTTLTLPVLEHAPTSYPSTVEHTQGVRDFYKLGESAGPTIHDSVGSANGTIHGGTFGLPGAVREDAGTALGFNGSSDSGEVPLNLSSTSQVTVEFWLKWSSYANNDSLAMELTPNFNANNGGFLVDPNASQYGGTFAVAIGPSGDRNSIYFQRPSAGVWHHYAFVLNTAAPAAGEIVPYVDGQPVSFKQEGAEAGQGAFANSTLYLMSRDGSALFGAGNLQYLAIYNKALSAATVFQHYYSYGGEEAPDPPPEETPPPPPPPPPSTPALAFSGLSANTYYNASTDTLYFRPASGGAFTVTAASSDPGASALEYAFSSLSAYGFTGTQSGGQDAYAFGESATQPPVAPTVTATNNAGESSSSASYSLVADTTAPTGGALTVNGVAAGAAGSSSYNTTGSLTIGARTDYGETQSATQSGLASSVLTRATGTLAAGSCSKYGTPETLAGTPAQSGLAEGCYLYTLTGADNVGNAASVSTTVKVDKTPPAATVAVPADANGAVAVTFGASDAGSGVNAASGQLKRAVATYTPASNTCGAFGAFANIGAAGPSSPYTDSTVATGHCYEYEYAVADVAGNSATSAPSTVRVNTAKPTLATIADTTPGSIAGLPQVGDAITLVFSDPIAASSVPSSVTLTYTIRSSFGPTEVALSGLGNGNWTAGDTGFAGHYTKSGGTAPVVTASTTVTGVSVKLTVTKVTDPSHNLTAGGPGQVKGTLNAALKDVFGNTASTGAFATGSVKLF